MPGRSSGLVSGARDGSTPSLAAWAWPRALLCCDLAGTAALRGGHAASDEVLCRPSRRTAEHRWVSWKCLGDVAQGLVVVMSIRRGAGGDTGTRRSRCACRRGSGASTALPRSDRELDVAHVAVVGLKLAHDGAQLVVNGLACSEVGQGQRVPDAGDDIRPRAFSR